MRQILARVAAKSAVEFLLLSYSLLTAEGKLVAKAPSVKLIYNLLQNIHLGTNTYTYVHKYIHTYIGNLVQRLLPLVWVLLSLIPS